MRSAAALFGLSLLCASAPSSAQPRLFPPEPAGRDALLSPGTVAFQAASASDAALVLDEVLAFVAREHPRVRAALFELDAASEGLRAARGGFDPLLRADGYLTTGGYYDLRRLSVEIAQPTPFWGTEVYGGYRLGIGVDQQRFPTYYPDRTLEGGELRLGVRIPLLRGGAIDQRRANIARADQRLDEVGAGSQLAVLELQMAAAEVYYEWLAAGMRLRVAADLLALSEERDQQFEGRERAGAIAPIERVDTRRMVLERQELSVRAERDLERASFRLSLFMPRTRDGELAPPELDRVPAGFDATSAEVPAAPIVAARVATCHPDIRRMEARRRVREVDAELAQNRVLPELSARLQVSRDLGDPARDPTLPGTIFDAGLTFSMPLGLRTPRGEAAAARALVAAADADLNWVRDQVDNLVRDELSRLDAARRRAELASELADLSEQLAAAERQRLAAGAGNLLFVNLREQAVADARIREAEAFAELHRAAFRVQLLAQLPCELELTRRR